MSLPYAPSPAAWSVPRARGPVRGSFPVPPSKSIQQRALALAVLADGASSVEADGEPAGDVAHFARALGALTGREVAPSGRVEGAFGPAGLGSSRASLRLDLGHNATGWRLAIALACLRPAGARTLLTGSPRLRRRPVEPLLRALRRLGAHARHRPTGAVRAIGGGLCGGAVSMRSDVSSQLATALCLAAPRFGGLALTSTGEPVSAGYLDLTLALLSTFGVPVRRAGRTWTVEGVAPRAARVRVEGDASSAAVWWAVAALTGGDVETPGVPAASLQPDLALLPVLARMGARVEARGDRVRVAGPGAGGLAGAGDVDLRGAPDLAPLVGALGAAAHGHTRVVGAPHLRTKESDRVATVVAALGALGVAASPADDGFLVEGRGRVEGGVVDAAGDHRLVLAFGALGLVAPVAIRGAKAVAKSWPSFPRALAAAASGAGGGGSDLGP